MQATVVQGLMQDINVFLRTREQEKWTKLLFVNKHITLHVWETCHHAALQRTVQSSALIRQISGASAVSWSFGRSISISHICQCISEELLLGGTRWLVCAPRG